MSNPLETFVDNALAARALTRDDLAGTLHVDRATLDDVLACTEPLSLDDAIALARALDVTLDALGSAAYTAANASGIHALEARNRLV